MHWCQIFTFYGFLPASATKHLRLPNTNHPNRGETPHAFCLHTFFTWKNRECRFFKQQEDTTEYKIQKCKKSSENATEMWEKNVQEVWWNSPSGIGADTEIPNESIFLKTCHTQSQLRRQPVCAYKTDEIFSSSPRALQNNYEGQNYDYVYVATFTNL